jgi:hypothetical protein
MTPSFHYEEFESVKGVIRIVYRRRTENTMAKRNKVQKDKQRSTKHTHKTKDRITRTPLKTGGEPRCSGREAVPIHLLSMCQNQAATVSVMYFCVSGIDFDVFYDLSIQYWNCSESVVIVAF